MGLQMVNEQIGTENMKRRVDLEQKRQRKMSKLKTKMWADYEECERMGYDWTARRAKWESELKELQALRDEHRGPGLDPIQTPKPHIYSTTGRTRDLNNDDLYAQAVSGLDELEEDAVPIAQGEDDADAEAAVLEWFKVHNQCYAAALLLIASSAKLSSCM